MQRTSSKQNQEIRGDKGQHKQRDDDIDTEQSLDTVEIDYNQYFPKLMQPLMYLISRKMKEPEFVRKKDKLFFIIFVNMTIVYYLLFMYNRELFIKFHIMQTTILLGIRYLGYRQHGYHYFFIDFCYFGNLLVILMLLGWIRSFDSFMAIFGYCFGPILTSAFVYRYSVVPHHFDKMLTYYIHVQPAFIVLITRFYSEYRHLT